jgi:hypothetical protein
MTLLLTASALTSACDPCDGQARCEVAPRVSYGGRVVDFATGRGVGGVGVVFRRTGGAELQGDSLVTATDGEGRFRLAAPVTARVW